MSAVLAAETVENLFTASLTLPVLLIVDEPVQKISGSLTTKHGTGRTHTVKVLSNSYRELTTDIKALLRWTLQDTSFYSKQQGQQQGHGLDEESSIRVIWEGSRSDCAIFS
jgi:hypothetical protein